MSDWRDIESAPKDGKWIRGRRGHLERDTAWCKTSHVPIYGWNYSYTNDPEDLDIWHPVEWKPLEDQPNE